MHDVLPVAIIGAGPAGLTAAYLLGKEGVRSLVLEADPQYVGGISRTVEYDGFRFDIGGHRFFSKSEAVEELWSEILPDDMLERPRSSRIYYDGKFFSYPLKAFEALRLLGPVEAARCVGSYALARLRPTANPRSFREWVTNQFGERLFNIFFRTYTEKVWGMSCDEISADWAAQRIKGLSMTTAILNALPKRRRRSGPVIKTLIESFRYPRLGPGMMWEACAARVGELGSEVRMGATVTSCDWDDDTQLWTLGYTDTSGTRHTCQARHVVSSAPLRHLAQNITPAMSAEARRAASALRYRDFLTVMLIVEGSETFDDNWIYIHDPSVKVGRIQNFKSWSPEMVPPGNRVSYGLEYFCFEGDDLWDTSDADLIELAKRELVQIGLAPAKAIVDGCVVRQPKAYPVYDDDYAGNVAVVAGELEDRYPTMHLVGRNGMHKYNNQDHAMMTAMLCVRNIVAGKRLFDVWRVNQDAEYHEEGAAPVARSEDGLRAVPRRIAVVETPEVGSTERPRAVVGAGR